jgi:putative glutamine amidotransferase
MQLLNVLRGGTLEQHLPERVGHEGHAVRPGVFAGHLVVPVAGTRLAGLLPEPVSVPTHHHQAVDQLGAGLVVSARAEDGTVEALELPGVAFAVGVQWHPEEGGGELRVVRALVAAAEESARQSGGRLL